MSKILDTIKNKKDKQESGSIAKRGFSCLHEFSKSDELDVRGDYIQSRVPRFKRESKTNRSGAYIIKKNKINYF